MKNTHKKRREDKNSKSKASFVRKASPGHEDNLDDKLELQIISIRLQKSLIEDLKSLAKANGLGYQPYIRQVLTQHIGKEKLK